MEQRQAFQRLHAAGCFVIPNPWDVGSARYLKHLGFQALATTSAGVAFSRGFPDGPEGVPLAEMLAHIREIAGTAELPLNADFGCGYADDPEGVAVNVTACVKAGVSGLSIEDATGKASEPLYDFQLAVERISAARKAIDESGTGVLLTARAECYLTDHPHAYSETLRRLEAYAEAGADVLYAPGVTSQEEIRAIVTAVAPKPVNVLMGSNIGMQVRDLANMGVRRISVGSSLARAAWTGFLDAARQIAEHGSFAGFDAIVPFSELNDFFGQDAKQRHSN